MDATPPRTLDLARSTEADLAVSEPAPPAASPAPAADGSAAQPDRPPGYRDHKEQVLGRLRRVEGQVRGLARMVENDAYCIDVLTQVAAATKALQAVAVTLLEEHVRHCVADATREGGPRADALVDEAIRSIERLMRV
jgi:DNA-binding FrmR family transcriptional regulator